jgi:hypothetical protein
MDSIAATWQFYDNTPGASKQRSAESLNLTYRTRQLAQWVLAYRP